MFIHSRCSIREKWNSKQCNPYRVEIRSCGKGKILLVTILKSVQICSLHGHYLGLVLSLGCQEESWGMGMILAVAAVLSVVGWMNPSQSSQLGSRDFGGIPIPFFLDISEIITREPANLGSADGCGDAVTCQLNAPEWRACHLTCCKGCELTTELTVMLRASEDTRAEVSLSWVGTYTGWSVCWFDHLALYAQIRMIKGHSSSGSSKVKSASPLNLPFRPLPFRGDHPKVHP